MVSLFIEHILGIGADHSGIFGKTTGYYGTVEQQGRLALHLHLLLWITCHLTPQEIRDKLQEKDSVFVQKLIAYLESVFVGEFLTGTHEEVKQRFDKDVQPSTYRNPVETLPVPPPIKDCATDCGICDSCRIYSTWQDMYLNTTDDIILKSNVHKCNSDLNKDGTKNKTKQYVGCKANKWGKCRARFPRPMSLKPMWTLQLAVF